MVSRLSGVDALDERLIGDFGIAGFDPLHLAIDVSGTGRSGGDLSQYLTSSRGVFVELVSERVLVAIIGMGEVESDSKPLIAGLGAAVDEVPPVAESDVTFALPPAGELVMSPQQAYFSAYEVVDSGRAVGRVAAETLAVYPPGIPNVLPGERVTQQNVEHVLDAHHRGFTVRGPVDRTLRTIRIVPSA